MEHEDDVNECDYDKLLQKNKRFRDLENKILFVRNGNAVNTRNGVKFNKGGWIWNEIRAGM